MAHNELSLDSNAIDVAFSKSGNRIAVLMKDHFSVFAWPLKTRPVPSPILESSYPLSDATDSRPRQIAFLNETEVYVLKDSYPNTTHVERTTLETRVTKLTYQAAESERLFSIFPSLEHETLWLSHINQSGRPISYSNIEQFSPDEFQLAPWAQCPTVDTYWAKAVQLSEDKVCSCRFPIYPFKGMLTPVACLSYYDRDRVSVREQAIAREELYLIPHDHFTHNIHHIPAPTQVCALGQH